MPEHETWFSYLLPGLHENIANLTMVLNRYVTGEDGTWIAHEGYGHGGASINHVVGALFVLLVLVVLGFIGRGRFNDVKTAVVPEASLSVSTFLELFVESVLSVMSGVMGKKNAKAFLPLIGTCAFFIFFSNALGLFPGLLPPTESLKTTLVCALVIFFATHFYGLKENGFNHIKHLFGPVTFDPKKPATVLAIPLMLLMFVIELIGHLARPVSLSLRLMANIFADHVVLGIFMTVAATFLGGLPLLLPVPIMLLGTMVVVVQTLVFCILSCVYIGMAIEHHDHGEHEEGHDDHAPTGAEKHAH
jgi:F-type H+-transporting ATPase subunit a